MQPTALQRLTASLRAGKCDLCSPEHERLRHLALAEEAEREADGLREVTGCYQEAAAKAEGELERLLAMIEGHRWIRQHKTDVFWLEMGGEIHGWLEPSGMDDGQYDWEVGCKPNRRSGLVGPRDAAMAQAVAAARSAMEQEE